MEYHEIEFSEELTRSYDTRHLAEIRHLGLGTYRIIKDMDFDVLQNKVHAQFVKWDAQWANLDQREKSKAEKIASQNLAEDRTIEAKRKIQEVESILQHTLSVDDKIDWESLKNKKTYPVPNPKNKLKKELDSIMKPDLPNYESIPFEPEKKYFEPKLNLLDSLIPPLKIKKIEKGLNAYKNALSIWENRKKQIEEENENLKREYKKANEQYLEQQEKVKDTYKKLEEKWEEDKEKYNQELERQHGKVEEMKALYFNLDPNSVVEYCEMVLNNSEYPDTFPKDFDIEYNSDSKLLVVEYTLPNPDQFPRISEVKYIISKKEIQEKLLSDAQFSKMFENAIYEIALRTIHELFEADEANALDFIVFNGWVSMINKANGKKENNCILSLQTNKSEFQEIDLSNIDAKACFKSLKGVSGNKLLNIVPIQPLLQVNKNDKRFVSSYDVAHKLDEGTNLAAMSWEDFEHLIRELFEKEFKSNGGEVKVTQASKDGGVDAIAFDPDPIRGGKIIIQAKRYTNTVGVSAVRDLYGTVMNEGATKGILVTTADYGGDAYEFSKNKPITLMNGGNLLFLLEKHGHKARIDIIEAKKLQGK